MSARRTQQDTEWLVRLFCDYAETPVWYHNPLGYQEMELSPTLQRDLEAFDEWFDRAQDPHDPYSIVALERSAYEAEGERLGQALALEIGSPFVVKVIHLDAGSGSRRYTSKDAGTNARATAAFHRMHDNPPWGPRRKSAPM